MIKDSNNRKTMTGLPVKSCICREEANLTVEGGSLKGPGNKLNNVTPFARIYVLPRVQQPLKFYLHVVTTVSFEKLLNCIMLL